MDELQCYMVGGAVRDELLKRPVSDRDWVVVGASPEQMLRLGFIPVGKDFPVFLHPQTKEEYALARTERKTAPGYRGFAITATPDVSLQDDLSRRDLTINAIARDTEGRLIDPYNGVHDIDKRWLRHVSAAFAEDPVRILRVARFYARYASLGFRIAPETMVLMREMVAAGEVDALVAERVWTELVKALGEPQPERFIIALRDCGALARLLPEIDRLFGVPQPAAHHPEIDTGLHILMCLRQAVKLNADTPTRFAVLVHDLGKGTTPPEQWPQHLKHESSGARLIGPLCQRLKTPNAYRELAQIVARYHLHAHRAVQMRPGKILKLLEACDAFRKPDRFGQFLIACEADARGRLGLEARDYQARRYLQQALQVSGMIDAREIIARGFEGQAIGEQMRVLRLAALTGLRENKGA